MRSSTETIARALRVLAATINAPDDVPRLALQEAADRLEELEEALYKALPFAEDAEASPEFKPGAVKKIVNQIHAALGTTANPKQGLTQ